MRHEDLEFLLRREPCPRLRLHMTSGEVFAIDDPDLVYFGRSTVELLLPPSEQGEREAILNVLHIVWVEVLAPSA
jgi:hypothetical protein